MRPTHALLALLLMAGLALADDAAQKKAEEAAKLDSQKKAAQVNWESAELGEAATAETAHLLLYAPKSSAKKLKEAGDTLEKYYAQARKPLGYEKEEPFAGKVAVYLLPERDEYTKFVRRVEKRRPESEEAGSRSADADRSHVVAGPPRAKSDPAVEGQAGEQLAGLLLAKKAGKVPLPAWLSDGFGRATWYRVKPNDKAVLEDRRKAAALAKKGTAAREAWGSGLEADDATVMQASLADFMAYGPGSAKFVKLLAGFRPEDNQEKKTTEQALEGANLSADQVNKAWLGWVYNPK